MGSTPMRGIARQYVGAVFAKGFATAASLFADGIVWHQSGASRFSGAHCGAAAIGVVAAAGGELESTGEPLVNGVLVSTPARFPVARRRGAQMGGVGPLRVEAAGSRRRLFTVDRWGWDVFWGGV
ncbi:nuclear transport factor 2 family protein [Nocardiopsis exhalans]|uniref:Nuclear transport factor 2 family protein n=1 Tax=Nocardiopsis exhalans TaxID=163604 RepID=A0ABY5D6S8_9ACTN|nr:nuclear transport factor 2 family protein [Nocardiopsis exhalans]USY18793.1 nuclear transport factor 2 family protein [Nocardiopsis exhalans]